MSVITPILFLASAAFTARAAAKTAQAQVQQGAAQAAAAEFNAKQIEKEGEFSERRTREETERLRQRQIAMLAARGIDVSSDSALDVVADTVRIGEEDALSIRYSKQQNAAITRFEGDEALAGSKIAAKSTLLTGQAQALGQVGRAVESASSFEF